MHDFMFTGDPTIFHGHHLKCYKTNQLTPYGGAAGKMALLTNPHMVNSFTD